MRKTVLKNVENMTDKEYKVCLSMNFKGEGVMQDLLVRPYEGTKVALVYEDDVVVGWGLRTPAGLAQVWTRRGHRNRGIGSKVVKRLDKVGPLIVAPHDDRSEAFFIKNNQHNWK
jgi:hypothetical protein